MSDKRQVTVQSVGEDNAAGIDFLDFLFTVAISVGLTPELLQVPWVTGLLSVDWYKTGRWPSANEAFSLGVYLLGFLNLTLSWFGYHASIKARPLNYFSGYGMTRFVLDVLLVVMYGILLIQYRSFDVALSLLLIIYSIFVVWDYLKICEYWETEFKNKKGTLLQRYRREWVSVFAFGVVVLIALPYFVLQMSRWFALALAICITVFYRFNKNHPTWEKLLG